MLALGDRMVKPAIGFVVVASLAGCAELEESTNAQQILEPPPAADRLELWLDADVGVGLRPDGEVYYWEDQSGHGRTLGRGAPSLPSITWSPKYPGSNHAGVVFTPDNNLSASYLVNGDVQVGQAFTIAMALAPIAPPPGTPKSDHVPLTGLSAPTVTIAEFHDDDIFHPSSMFRATTGGGGSEPFQALGQPNSWSAAPHIIIAQFNKDHSRFHVDGVPIRQTDGLLGKSPLTGIALSAGGRTYRGYIGLVFVFRGTLQWWEEQALYDYMAARYPAQPAPPPNWPALPPI